MTMNGIDISHWQAGMDVSKVNADFVIMKATEGLRYVDPSCNTFYAQAKASGKLRGLYHYANSNDPKAEAQFFVNNIKNYVHDAILCLDWEKTGNRLFGTASGPAWIKAWCDEVYRLTGVKPLVYVSAAYRSQTNGIGDYGLWIAQYANASISGYQAHPWNEGAYTCAIRQYKGTGGRVNGYSGDVDLDIAYMDAAAWNKYANPSGAPQAAPAANKPSPAQPAPQPAHKSNAEIAAEVYQGKWGNDPVRSQKLRAAGYDPVAIQKIVNETYYGKKPTPQPAPQPARKSNAEIAKEVYQGKWGNDPVRSQKLRAAGYDPATIQALVNSTYYGKKPASRPAAKPQPARKANAEIAKEVYQGKWGNDPVRSQRLRAAGYDPKTIQALVNSTYYRKR